jgi:hypothetical protein
MTFRKANNLSGWLIFLIALATYVLTREARGSLWDTGEFIASAKGLQLPHPPGAPLFVLLGRFFIVLFGDNPMTTASAVNFMSALASAATILLLFWSITHFGRKLFAGAGEELSKGQIAATMAAGAVGALAYTFSDSFWFSAVEGEVYALSSFFTALVFWAMLKWEQADERAGGDRSLQLRADRWIVFLFFMMGLSIGVHLLNLLTIPAIVMIYYFRRFKFSVAGTILAFLIGCAITGLVQVGVIQYSMKAAGEFDIFFVNQLGQPFFYGFAFYFVALATLILVGLQFKESQFNRPLFAAWAVAFLFLLLTPSIVVPGDGLKIWGILALMIFAGLLIAFFKPIGLRILKLSLWSYAFIMLGYCLYFTTLIRSNANPGIDMNNVDNPINLVYYLSREQYGSAPLVYGPHFAADPSKDLVIQEEGVIEKIRAKSQTEASNIHQSEELRAGRTFEQIKDSVYTALIDDAYFIKSEMKYVKGDKRYIPIGRSKEYRYSDRVKQLFPRVWDSSDDQYHAQFYAEWLGLRNPEDGSYNAPRLSDNISWFFSYQMSWMYWRYFMWNFAGKQNDIQGMGNVRDGNWVTGISFLDNARLGDQSKLPSSMRPNAGTNYYFLLPFVLGVIGFVFQAVQRPKDWIVSFLLFFFTGIAIVLYLNQPGNQPRERDYAYVGSFYAFAIWIGLALIAFVQAAAQRIDVVRQTAVIGLSAFLAFWITFMSSFPSNGWGPVINAVAAAGITAFIGGALSLLLGLVSNGGKKYNLLVSLATVCCLAVPALMANQNWDDHDRSQKTTAPDLARNYLESCAPNAIIFSFGDNDTYPLWYAQEVEGVRTDVRVINNSLLGIDWYINQLRYKINDADSLDVLWGPEKIQGNTRNYVSYTPIEGIDQDAYYDLYDVMKNYVGSDDPSRMDNSRGEALNMLPINKVVVPVDRATVLQNGTANPEDSIFTDFGFELPERGLMKNELIILNIIASNKWKRPIYFTSPYGELGFGPFLRKEGLAYRLVPVKPAYSQMNWVTDQAMRSNGLGGTPIRDNNLAVIYTNLMEKYRFGGASINGMYFDEENRRHMLNIREIYAEAAGNLADAGKMTEAKALMGKIEKEIPATALPYAMVSRYNSHNQTALIYLEACYKAGMKELAAQVGTAIKTDLEQQEKYYKYISAKRPKAYPQFQGAEEPINERLLLVLAEIETKYK